MDIIYRESDEGLNAKNLVELWHSVDWYEGSAKNPERLLASIKNSDYVVTVWDNEKLIGLAPV